jgi:hypothetical protein
MNTQETASEAIARCDAGTDPLWAEEAWQFLLRYIEHHDDVFPDDLWAAGLREPRERRALGPLLIRAKREGLIVKSADYRKSVRAHSSRRSRFADMVVWRVVRL